MAIRDHRLRPVAEHELTENDAARLFGIDHVKISAQS
jgi:hypothetical protein